MQRKGPNPFLMLGVFTASIVTFAIVTERRAQDPKHRRREFHGPQTPMTAEKVELPPRSKVEGGN